MSWGRAFLPLALVLALAALLWFWPTLAFGFRSDDFLLGYYCDPAGGAHWDRAFAEFGRPWFQVRDLYRPLVSVSHAACYEFGSDPLPFRVFNLLVLAVTAVATAGIAARLAPMRSGVAAAVAGAVVILHPASVETAAWIAARTSGLEAMFTTLAALAFLLRLQGRLPLWPSTVCAALALASKEGAVALPALLLALDLAVQRRRPFSERARLHAPFLVLLAIYFCVRWNVLGVFTTADETHSALSQAEAAWWRAVSWFAPPDSSGGAQWITMVSFLALAVAAPGTARKTALLVAVGGVAMLVPTSLYYEPVGFMSGRLVFPAVPALAVAFGVMLVSAAEASGASRAFAWAATVGWIAAAGLMSRTWIASYGEQDALIREIQESIPVAAARAEPGKPCALSMLPALPLLQPNMWGLLGAPPFASRDFALVSLAGILSKDVTSPGLFGDAALAHALSESGGGSLSWNPGQHRFEPLVRPKSEVAELAPVDEPGVFASNAPLPAAAYAAIEVELDEPAREIALSLRDDFAGEWAFGTVVRKFESPVRKAVFDLSHSMLPLLRAGNGGAFGGVRVEVGGQPMRSGRVRALASIPSSGPLPNDAGAFTVARYLSAALVPPRNDVPLRLYLMSPLHTICVDVPAGGAPRLEPFEVDKLELAAGVVDGCPVHWMWQTPPGYAGDPWRSGIHWRRLR